MATAPGPSCRSSSTPNAPVRILRKNPNYWNAGQPKARLPACHRSAGGRRRRSRRSRRAGRSLLNVDPSVIPSLQDDPNVQLLETGASNSMTVSMWVDTPAIRRHRVRQALKLVVDRQAMVDTVLLGFGETGADNPVPLERPAAHVQDPPQRDIEQAKQLLAEAGHEDGLKLRSVYRRRRAGHGAHGPGVRRDGQAGGFRQST